MPSSRIDRCRCPLAGGLVVDDSVGGFFIIFEHGVTRRWDPCGRGLGTGVGSNAPADRSWPKCAKAPCQICGRKIEKWRQNMLENGFAFGSKLSEKWVGFLRMFATEMPGILPGKWVQFGWGKRALGSPQPRAKSGRGCGSNLFCPGEESPAPRLGIGVLPAP